MNSANLSAVHHMNWLEWRYCNPNGTVTVRIRTAREDFDRVLLLHAPNYTKEPFHRCITELPMTLSMRDSLHDVYEATVSIADPRWRYVFALEKDGQRYYVDQDGPKTLTRRLKKDDLTPFPFAYAYRPEAKPAWSRGCVGYQIFPDRFAREGEMEPGVEPWGSDRVQNRYRFGGNLRGIIQKVPYLKELGIDLVYMTPIFLSNTSHRYNTFDYFKVDPLLGTEEDLKELADTLHQNGMRLVLDGVFNHSGTKFFAFREAKKDGENSPYRDWFFFDDSQRFGYRTFGDVKAMPKLNLQNPACQEYFLSVGAHWLRTCGIDGWRLDVSPEVWPDFWRSFRKMVRGINPDALIIAECWDDSREWLTTGDMFDSTMNYVWSRAMWRYFAEGSITLEEFDSRINRTFHLYPAYINPVLWNFLDSHDTMRLMTRAKENMDRFSQSVFFQMTCPGVPIVYYGDELGLTGGEDPGCRKSMPWEKAKNHPVFDMYRRLIALRHTKMALREGNFKTASLEDGIYAYLRACEAEKMLLVMNREDREKEVALTLPEELSAYSTLRDALSGKEYSVHGGSVRLLMPAFSCMALE